MTTTVAMSANSASVDVGLRPRVDVGAVERARRVGKRPDVVRRVDLLVRAQRAADDGRDRGALQVEQVLLANVGQDLVEPVLGHQRIERTDAQTTGCRGERRRILVVALHARRARAARARHLHVLGRLALGDRRAQQLLDRLSLDDRVRDRVGVLLVRIVGMADAVVERDTCALLDDVRRFVGG